MKKQLILLLGIFSTVAALAFDFTGKTFRGTGSMNGTKVTITYRFKSNNRMSGTIAIQGQKPDTDSGMHWEILGDYMNIYDSTGDRTYMEISESEGKPVLIAFDSYGREAMVFKQVMSGSTSENVASEDVGQREKILRRDSLRKISNGYVRELESARDSIKNSFKLTAEEEVFLKNKRVNLNAPEIKEAWSGYLSKRQDIREFIDAHKSDEDLNSKLENVIRHITDEFDFNQCKYDAVNDKLKSAELEALKWGAKSKEQIRKKALLCYPASPVKEITYIITSDRSDGDGKGSFYIESKTIKELESSCVSVYDVEEHKKKIEWYTWLMDQYSYIPISDISEITDDDFFLWAVSDNMKFDNNGNFKLIDKKIKRPERVLQAVNAIRQKIPPFIPFDNIIVARITYGLVKQPYGVTYDYKEITKIVNAGAVYEKAKNSEEWLKLKESFAKAVEKASKKKH